MLIEGLLSSGGRGPHRAVYPSSVKRLGLFLVAEPSFAASTVVADDNTVVSFQQDLSRLPGRIFK